MPTIIFDKKIPLLHRDLFGSRSLMPGLAMSPECQEIVLLSVDPPILPSIMDTSRPDFLTPELGRASRDPYETLMPESEVLVTHVQPLKRNDIVPFHAITTQRSRPILRLQHARPRHLNMLLQPDRNKHDQRTRMASNQSRDCDAGGDRPKSLEDQIDGRSAVITD